MYNKDYLQALQNGKKVIKGLVNEIKDEVNKEGGIKDSIVSTRNEILDDLFNWLDEESTQSEQSKETGVKASYVPNINVKNDNVVVRQPFNIIKFSKGVKFELLVPGFTDKDILVTFENSVLRVVGTTPKQDVQDYEQKNFGINGFNNAFKIIQPVEQIAYKVENGILIVEAYYMSAKETKITLVK